MKTQGIRQSRFEVIILGMGVKLPIHIVDQHLVVASNRGGKS